MTPAANGIWRPYCQMKTAEPPLAIAATSGCELITADGRRLVDGMASWWAACHGYNHPRVVAAVREQAARMPHVMFGGITHEPAERLCQRLLALVDPTLRHLFFADSGSVAIEVAMKMAVGYWQRHGRPQRTQFVTFDHAYHGDTTGAMSLCDPHRSMHAAYGKALSPQFHTSLPVDAASDARLDELLERHRDTIAAVCVEPLIQGAGGMRFHDESTVHRIAAACHRHGVLLIFDEIATGFGRTGTMFAHQQLEISPDITCFGKALTAGTMTMAVTLANDRVFDAFWSDDTAQALMHGPTFMANPLACAAALASLDIFETEFDLDRVMQTEHRLWDGLANCIGQPGVVDVRCRGAVGVVQMDPKVDVTNMRSRLVDAGVWLRPFGDCLYTTPCLNTPWPQLDKITEAMADVVSSR
ncbi:MAG: adenosylmethionine--8-amino-7-oxononanoate transaminase [Planctomycetota bacterium]